MKRNLKKTLNLSVAFVFLIIGLFGFLLPFLPGIIFVAVAFLILSFELPYLEKFIEKNADTETTLGKNFLKLKNLVEKYLK